MPKIVHFKFEQTEVWMLEEFLLDPKSGIVLIDMQRHFVRALRPGAAERIIPAQKEVLLRARTCGTPIAILEYAGDGETISELANIIKGGKEPNYETFTKRYDSGFVSSHLDEWLRGKGVNALLLMGINACYCVKATARDALSSGYSVATSPKLIAGQGHHRMDDDTGWYGANGSLLAV